MFCRLGKCTPLNAQYEQVFFPANYEKLFNFLHRAVCSRGSKTPPKVRQAARDSGDRRKRIKHVQDMTLEHVHGYRGFDTRNNVHYLGDGDIVYHTAATGIVLNPKDGTQSFYLEHTDDIVCLSVNRHPKFKVFTSFIYKDRCLFVCLFSTTFVCLFPECGGEWTDW